MKHHIKIDKMYQDESTALERSVMIYWGGEGRGWEVGAGGGGGWRVLKLTLQDPNPRPHLP